MATRCLIVKTELTFYSGLYTRTPLPGSDRVHNFLPTYPSPRSGLQTCTFHLGLWGGQSLPKEANVP